MVCTFESSHDNCDSESERVDNHFWLLNFPKIEWVDSCEERNSVQGEVRCNQAPVCSMQVRKTSQRRQPHMIRSLAVRRKLASMYSDDASRDALQCNFKT
eukprot:scaffold2649_cov137-Cylindrotheca_fusiformis.AAC.16